MLNLRLALRTLFKTPFVTTIAALSLALGIGANTAIFSLFNQMLLQPLPVDRPEGLVNLAAPGPKPGSQSCNMAGDCDVVFSYAMFRDLEQETDVLSGLAAHRIFGANLASDGQTTNGLGVLVSGSYFPTLGLRPALGRLLTPQDDAVIGEAPVVVLSHLYWTLRFGSDASAVGRTLKVNGVPMTIVGVAPEGFHGTTFGPRPQVYVPITMRGQVEPTFTSFDNRRTYWIYVFGRLAPGVSVDSARTRLNARYNTIIGEVEAPLQQGMSDATMERFRAKPLVVEPGPHGQSDIRADATTPLTMLLAVTGVVLLIACANIANLLLARSASRANEMAVRLSIGASRSALIRQLLLESCILALIGGATGLVVARWTLQAIAWLLPAEAAATVALDIDPLVLAFAAGLSIFTGLLFGLFPALHSTRPDLATTLKGTSGQPSGNRGAARFRSGLVVAQMALSMALLTSAGLFLKSLYQVSRVDLGLVTEDVTTFRVSPRLNGYSVERSLALFEEIERALAVEPGVQHVTASMVPLLAGSNWGTDVRVQGFESGPDIDSNSRLNAVGPGYFATLGIPVLAGREFTDSDRAGTRQVAIVNEAFAEKFGLARESVVGTLMARGGTNGELDIEIVGLVQNSKYSEVKGAIPPLFFTPYRQDDRIGSVSFYVRSALAPEHIVRRVAPIVSAIDRDLPVEDLRTLPQQVRENVFLDRFISTMAAAFAALATVLAGIGLYGVLAFTVAQRTREFGLRMALGADAASVRGLVLRQVGMMTFRGGLIGIGLAWLIGREAESLLFEMTAADPVVFAAALGLLGTIAILAGLLPATRASRVDPMRALRWE